MIDSTIVRAHQHSASAQKSRRRPSDRPLAQRAEHKGPHLRQCDGKPGRLLPSRGEAHDLVGADHLLAKMQADTLIADKALDANGRILEPLAAARKAAVILLRGNLKGCLDHEHDLFKAPRLIENPSVKLKQFKDTAT